nr:MAG TPA_asm: hypothetical protein [Bacteriophage sp.]
MTSPHLPLPLKYLITPLFGLLVRSTQYVYSFGFGAV